MLAPRFPPPHTQHSDLTPAEAEQQVAALKEHLALKQQQEHQQQQQKQQEQGQQQNTDGGAGGGEQQRQTGRAEGPNGASGDNAADGAAAAPARARGSVVLAATDVCLRALPRELLPVGLPLLVQYDVPPTKDVFSRRLAAVFGGGKDRRARQQGGGGGSGGGGSGSGGGGTGGGSGGARQQQRAPVVIDFVVAGELPAFRARERFSAAPVLEMPVHAPDIL